MFFIEYTPNSSHMPIFFNVMHVALKHIFYNIFSAINGFIACKHDNKAYISSCMCEHHVDMSSTHDFNTTHDNVVGASMW